MEDNVRQWIVDILNRRQSLLSVAVAQRAKFEGWLKFELADYAQRHGAAYIVVVGTVDAGDDDGVGPGFGNHLVELVRRVGGEGAGVEPFLILIVVVFHAGRVNVEERDQLGAFGVFAEDRAGVHEGPAAGADERVAPALGHERVPFRLTVHGGENHKDTKTRRR